MGDPHGPDVYNTWANDWRYSGPNKKVAFFYPAVQVARFNLSQNIRANDTLIGKAGAVALSPIFYLATFISSAAHMLPTNAEPPENWLVKCNAPFLPYPFLPEARRFGKPVEVFDGDKSSVFNEDIDAQPASRNADKRDQKEGDPYDQYQPSGVMQNGKKYADIAAAQGNEESEAGQRYEDHSIARMNARHENRDGWVVNDAVVGESAPDAAQPSGYKEWHDNQIKLILDSGIKNNPSNHSTIMTNPNHAEKALAYDVAVGVCRFSDADMTQFRLRADWRFAVSTFDKSEPDRIYADYFTWGAIQNKNLPDWLAYDKQLAKPKNIMDTRSFWDLLGAVGKIV